MTVKITTSITIESKSTDNIFAEFSEGEIHIFQGKDLFIIAREDAEDIIQALMDWVGDNKPEDDEDAP